MNDMMLKIDKKPEILVEVIMENHHLSQLKSTTKIGEPSFRNSNERQKNTLTFHYTGRIIGILIMVYYDPQITG